jgi:hypothetical protein
VPVDSQKAPTRRYRLGTGAGLGVGEAGADVNPYRELPLLGDRKPYTWRAREDPTGAKGGDESSFPAP